MTTLSCLSCPNHGAPRVARAACTILLTVLVSAGVPAHLVAGEVRTWTDSTGEFKIEAEFVSETDGTVTLKLKSGDEVEIKLDRLSDGDRDFIANLKKNPFKPAESNPFRPRQQSADAGSRAPRVVDVDLSSAEPILLADGPAAWKVDVPAVEPLAFRLRTVPLPPKSDFFEKLKGVAVSQTTGRAVVGYVLGRPGSKETTTRLVLCDLKTGKVIAQTTTAGQMAPIALHDDGRQVLMRRDEFGFGNQDRLEIWTIEEDGPRTSLVWTPYGKAWAGKKDVMWAAFLDDARLVTSSRGGQVVVWDYPSLDPLYTLDLCDGAVPALSPDRKLIGFCNGDELGLFDIDRHSVIARTATPRKLQWPTLAFSPSGGRLGCVANDEVLAWDVATGELLADMPATGIQVKGSIAFPHEEFILGGDKFLLDLEHRLKLWEYQGVEHVTMLGEYALLPVANGDHPGALIPATLPHPAAATLLEQALNQPELFVFREGTRVRIDVSAIDAGKREEVRTALVAKLTALRCTPADDGTIDLVATVDAPKKRKVSYIHSGEYEVTDYITHLKFVYKGEVVWQAQGGNIPGIISVGRGENVASILEKASQQPAWGFYQRVELPRFLQRPTAGTGPGSGQTLGKSQVTTSGV